MVNYNQQNTWKYGSLKNFGDFKNGVNKGKEDFGHGTKFVNIQDIFRHPIIDSTQLNRVNVSDKEVATYRLEKGDILFVRSSVKPEGVGYPALFMGADEDVVYSGFTIRYRPVNGIFDSKFLLYTLLSDNFRRKLLSLATISANTNINQEALSSLEVPVPPIAEQRKIAAILSSVDEAIEKTEAIIEQTEKVKKGLMQQLLTKGIGHTKFKKTEIGEIPEEWDVKTIGELAEKIIGGGTPPREIQDYYKGKIPWATVKDITYHILDTTEEYISDKAVENSSTNVIPAGNVIIATRIGLGKVFMNTVDMAINQDLKGIIPKKELIEAEYLLWYLLSKTKKIESMGTGTTVKGIRLEQLKGIFIPIPQKNEQKKIVSILNKLEGKIANERKKHITLLSLKKGLMHVLLTGKVRVKVDDEVVSS